MTRQSWRLCLFIGAGFTLIACDQGTGDSPSRTGADASTTRKNKPAVNNKVAPSTIDSRQPLERRQQVSGRAYFIKAPPTETQGDALHFVSERLKLAEAGDGIASYEIHLRAESCRRATEPGDAGVYRGYAKVGLGLQYMQSIESELADCKSLMDDQQILSTNWLELAAAQGSVEAQLLYAQNPRAILGSYQDVLTDPDRLLDYRSTALSHLQSALSSGSLDALDALGDIYSRGILAPASPPDAYIHKLALQRLDPRPSREHELAELKAHLSPDQLVAAEPAATKIINACCI